MSFNELVEITGIELLKDDIFKFEIKSKNITNSAFPGQFLEIRVNDDVEPFLRRPISIYNIKKEDEKLEFIFQVKGKGTKILSTKKVGDKISVLGPLGNGKFDLKDNKNIAIIGGGIGIFPLHEFAKETLGKANITTYLGFRSKEYVILENEFGKVSNKLIISTDDGSYKENGFAIDILKKDYKTAKFDAIYACGPLPMLKSVKDFGLENNIPTQVSLEEKMGCGIGICLGCAVKNKNSEGNLHVCKDGPVFDIKDVEF